MIEIKSLSKFYSDFTLKNVNIFIKKGEFIGILGQSGSGKSTLLNLIAGLDKDYEGSILIEGKKPIEIIKKGEIGMIFQKDLLLPHLNVWENISFGLKIKKIDKCEIESRVKNIIKEMGLVGKEKKYPNELSGGERQRVSIGRALVTKPKLLLMDEPFSALDFNLREKMQKLIKGLHEKLKITVIFVTHDREEAFYLSNRIGIMLNGKFLDFDIPETLYYNPKYLYTARLLSVENIYPVEKFNQIFQCKTEKCNFVGLRGKNIRIVKESSLKGVILDIDFKMNGYLVTVLLKDEKIKIIQDNKINYKIGDVVYLEYDIEKKILIEGDKKC